MKWLSFLTSLWRDSPLLSRRLDEFFFFLNLRQFLYMNVLIASNDGVFALSVLL